MAYRLFTLLILFMQGKLGSCGICSASPGTVVYVPSCPTIKDEWDKAAHKKNCSAVKQNCTTADNFVYHCLANPFQDLLIEVCSEPAIISFPVCAEYNERGNIVQENHFTDCSSYDPPCPNRYISTDTFKYRGCYNITQRTTTVTTISTQETTTKHFTRISNVNTTKPTELSSFQDSFHMKHPQLVLAFLVAIGITAPVSSILCFLKYFASIKKTPKMYTIVNAEDTATEKNKDIVGLGELQIFIFIISFECRIMAPCDCIFKSEME
ncbi:uncharacterized protein LOC134262816 isoform X2 [Saccostrea cucullata]|uniref:uncharacterized protein LOC134262816 isoform X2 n=1 Tax=Saccostrea cuccullata TaxID=36930 RepID=UPI002ECFCDAB